MHSAWDRRIARAEALAGRWSFAAEALRFYVHLARFQAGLQDALRGSVGLTAEPPERLPLRAFSPVVHGSVLRPHFPRFLKLVEEVGPPQLAAAAAALGAGPPHRWEELWEAYWRGEVAPWTEDPALGFFPKAFLQPYAALLAAAVRGNGEDVPASAAGELTSGTCPVCGAAPQVAVLREEAHGAARWLLCSRCETEWRYQRVRCVACGEEDFQRLVHLQAAEWPHVRVSACQACGRYVKEVDLTRDGLAVPVVDEMAAMPLDLVAAEEGYRKVEPNLIGL